MKARETRNNSKADSPRIGNWLKWFTGKRTCRKWKRSRYENELEEKDEDVTRHSEIQGEVNEEIFRIRNGIQMKDVGILNTWWEEDV
jgi:hypothetical protein